MEEVYCARCGKKLNGKKWMVQIVEYLGVYGERMPICENCYASLMKWLYE